MTDVEDVVIALASTRLQAGGLLEGTVSVRASAPVEGLELAVIWLATARGGVDEGVIHYERLAADVHLGQPVGLDVRLPLTPTTFAGERVSISWMVRVRERTGRLWDRAFTVTP
jgi:hypothetical protein